MYVDYGGEKNGSDEHASYHRACVKDESLHFLSLELPRLAKKIFSRLMPAYRMEKGM